MKPEYVKVQKHCINESFLVTMKPITKGDVLKTVRRKARDNGESLREELWQLSSPKNKIYVLR